MILYFSLIILFVVLMIIFVFILVLIGIELIITSRLSSILFIMIHTHIVNVCTIVTSTSIRSKVSIFVKISSASWWTIFCTNSVSLLQLSLILLTLHANRLISHYLLAWVIYLMLRFTIMFCVLLYLWCLSWIRSSIFRFLIIIWIIIISIDLPLISICAILLWWLSNRTLLLCVTPHHEN